MGSQDGHNKKNNQREKKTFKLNKNAFKLNNTMKKISAEYLGLHPGGRTKLEKNIFTKAN